MSSYSLDDLIQEVAEVRNISTEEATIRVFLGIAFLQLIASDDFDSMMTDAIKETPPRTNDSQESAS